MSSATKWTLNVIRVYREGTLAGLRIPVTLCGIFADSEREAIARCSGPRKCCVTRRKYVDVVISCEESSNVHTSR